MNRRPSPATVLSLVALFIALSGTSYAALTVSGKNVKNGSLASADVKNSSLTGKDVKNNSLTGADVAEARLGKVNAVEEADHAKTADSAKTASNAAALGGQPAAALADQSTISVPFAQACDPTSDGNFIDCGSTTVTLPRAGRLVMLGELAYGTHSPANASRGRCQFFLDGQIAAQSPIFGARGDLVDSHRNGGVFNALTNPLPAGPHTVALRCNQLGGNISFDPARVTVLAVSAK